MYKKESSVNSNKYTEDQFIFVIPFEFQIFSSYIQIHYLMTTVSNKLGLVISQRKKEKM